MPYLRNKHGQIVNVPNFILADLLEEKNRDQWQVTHPITGKVRHAGYSKVSDEEVAEFQKLEKAEGVKSAEKQLKLDSSHAPKVVNKMEFPPEMTELLRGAIEAGKGKKKAKKDEDE